MITTNLPPSLPPTHPTSTSSPPIQHRQNRRRERPGSRARRTISRKSALATDLNEGILEARDSSFYIPNHRPGNGPSPLLRQNFDQSWMRWKARQTAELEMLAMKQNMKQVEMERQMMTGEVKGREEEELGKMQRRLFGGDDDDDDALCHMKALRPSTPTSTSQDQIQNVETEKLFSHSFRPPKLRRTESSC
ncbi:predicted protein [Sclerotinia sclerotiorum 1980 UF-70]|uniref:Uncharacterized protein n=2 Tax=Sclerotinia sclerotiorum (strain ATCC 18683 / 1980 / Ss-1) TaxID=665079 RepID=A7EPC9_SCLS1|nr:predicted protein [Sclerotinia sclerotiorum 1980 UF-70]APA10354.1 hypothetical protein sscle_06g051240 [Sclerotinia sclerotiorum 1980 UF-70]EDO04695.1 predicted protein [Sclerotinia sclerotiorum 1980 UF-70]